MEVRPDGFYLEGKPFIPLIQDHPMPCDWSNTVTITLPCQLQSDLNWTKEEGLASQAVAAGKFIFWELDLGLIHYECTPEDTTSFFAFTLAIEEFSKRIFPKFQQQTFGACIYRGKWEPVKQFPLKSWEEADPQKAFAEYLHRLAAFLPESLPIFLLLDVSDQPHAATLTQLLLDLEYFHIGLKGAKAPFLGICWEEGYPGQGWLGNNPEKIKIEGIPTTGLCIPDKLDRELHKRIDTLLASSPMRLVAEEKLTEEWHGLEKLIVFSDYITLQGKRKLLGFEAAGGLWSTSCSKLLFVQQVQRFS